MKIFGHRGAPGVLPENTLASIQHAIKAGVDGVEFDVRCTKDGIPVLLHDETLSRTTSIPERVDQLTITDLMTINKKLAHPIPTLKEVIPQIGPNIIVNVEIKEIRAVESTNETLADALSQKQITLQQLLVSAFDHRALDTLREIGPPDLPVGLLTAGHPSEEFWETADRLAATSANIDLPSVSPEFIQAARQRNLSTMVYTVNDREAYDRVSKMGADAIFTDHPSRFIAPGGD